MGVLDLKIPSKKTTTDDSTDSQEYTDMLAGLSVFGGISQARGYDAMGDYQNAMAKITAGFADRSAADAVKRGKTDAANYRTEVNKTVGSQKAAFAAQGVDVGSGSASDVTEGTAITGAMDALTIRNNSYREALGYKMQSIDAQNKGSLAKIAATNQSAGTILNGGLQALSYIYGKKG